MAFVHSLVKIRTKGKPGWCAPLEVGEAAPHYISFVIPVADNRSFFDKYTCETIRMNEGQKKVEVHVLIKRGDDSFGLCVCKTEFWFAVRPSPKNERPLPYVGKLGHDDFRYRFVEIEPEDPDTLDELYEGNNTFIIGCEPFSHYTNIDKFSRKRLSLEG